MTESSSDLRIGIDLGGTKIEAVVIDRRGHVVWRTRVASPRGSYEATVAALVGLVAEAERAVGVSCTVGIGIPGAVSPATGLIKNANSQWLNGRPLAQDLERALARDVRLANDANCLTISEATDGAATGAAIVFGVILGTGTGGGIVVNGRLVTGANAIGGEWGHNPLPWPNDDERPGRPCYCGRSGCIETFLSGPGLAADHERRSGRHASPESIVAAAGAGDPLALETLAVWESRLARSLATIINVLDPDIIVVGGGLSQVRRLYEHVPEQWGPWIFSDAVATRIVPAMHGDASGVRGAAWLWPLDRQ